MSTYTNLEYVDDDFIGKTEVNWDWRVGKYLTFAIEQSVRTSYKKNIYTYKHIYN